MVISNYLLGIRLYSLMNLYKLLLLILTIFRAHCISSSIIQEIFSFGGDIFKTSFTNFMEFSTSHNKKYSSANIAKFREEIFNKNLKKVQGLNSNPNNSYPQGMTIYADLTEEEFVKMILNPKLQTTP